MTNIGGDASDLVVDAEPEPAEPDPIAERTGRGRYRGRYLRKKDNPSTTRSIVEWVLVLGGALVVALLIRNFLFTTFWIPSESMQPTLIGDPDSSGRHDRVVVNRLSYRFHDVRRGDIIVFTTPATESPVTENGRKIKDLIKRVVGLPGETVTLENSAVYINGKKLDEPYIPEGSETVPICQLSSTFEIPKGHVLVMGDNREHSLDGRCFGPIDTDTIVGRAFVRIWPLGQIGWL